MQWGEVDPLLDAKGFRTGLLVGVHWPGLLQMSPCHCLEDGELAPECQTQPFPTPATVILIKTNLGKASLVNQPWPSGPSWAVGLPPGMAPGGLPVGYRTATCPHAMEMPGSFLVLVRFPILARSQAEQEKSLHTQFSLIPNTDATFNFFPANCSGFFLLFFIVCFVLFLGFFFFCLFF